MILPFRIRKVVMLNMLSAGVSITSMLIVRRSWRSEKNKRCSVGSRTAG